LSRIAERLDTYRLSDFSAERVRSRAARSSFVIVLEATVWVVENDCTASVEFAAAGGALRDRARSAVGRLRSSSVWPSADTVYVAEANHLAVLLPDGFGA